jgi:hypothetical protein
MRERFHIARVCVVADRGMISAATITALEERNLEYILGAGERSTTARARARGRIRNPFGNTPTGCSEQSLIGSCQTQSVQASKCSIFQNFEIFGLARTSA